MNPAAIPTARRCHDCPHDSEDGRRRCAECAEAHRLAAHAGRETPEARCLRRIMRRLRQITPDLDALRGAPEHERALRELRRLATGIERR